MYQLRTPDIECRPDMVTYRFQVAREDLETARYLLDASFYRVANNRAYYSIYNTVDAVLTLDGQSFDNHKDALSLFDKHYVETEIFPRDLGLSVMKSEEIRQDRDNDSSSDISMEVATQQVKAAEQLLALAENYFYCHERELSERNSVS